MKLNIVYANMQCASCEVTHSQACIRWTRIEEPDADIVVYHNGYSYRKKYAQAKAIRILYMYEPPVVYPRQYLRSFWRSFDVILTWSRTLADQGGPFQYFPSLYYDFPFGAAHGVKASPAIPADWKSKRRAICQIAGYKRSLMPSALYERRREIACWFNAVGQLPFDSYGTPPMPVPNHLGIASDKRETMSGYRYSLCLENDAHPVWCRGYVTEKIFDCFYAFTLPVYLGAPDIDATIPHDCYVDLREFKNLHELDVFLMNMTDAEYERRLMAIESFLRSYNAPHRHSCFRLYEAALALATHSPSSEAIPFGYWQKASWNEKLRCAAMTAAVPVYRIFKGSRYAGT